MGFRTSCDAEVEDDNGKIVKCRKLNKSDDMEPAIDKVTGIVWCQFGHPLKNQGLLTEFAKRQMVSMGQTRKADKQQKAFSVKCKACEKEGPPNLSKDGKKLSCPYCKVELTHLAKPFATMLKSTLAMQKNK